MGGALEAGYLYVALTPPSIAWRAAAASRILREVQSSCMIFIFTVLIFLVTFRSEFSCTQYEYLAYTATEGEMGMFYYFLDFRG